MNKRLQLLISIAAGGAAAALMFLHQSEVEATALKGTTPAEVLVAKRNIERYTSLSPVHITVEKVPARFGIGIEHLVAGFLIGTKSPLRTKAHGAQADLGNFEPGSAQQSIVQHRISFLGFLFAQQPYDPRPVADRPRPCRFPSWTRPERANQRR